MHLRACICGTFSPVSVINLRLCDVFHAVCALLDTNINPSSAVSIKQDVEDLAVIRVTAFKIPE